MARTQRCWQTQFFSLRSVAQVVGFCLKAIFFKMGHPVFATAAGG